MLALSNARMTSRGLRRLALAAVLGGGLLAPAPGAAVQPLCPRSVSVMIKHATHVVAARPVAMKAVSKDGWRYERARYALVRAFVGQRPGRALLVERTWKEGPAPSGPRAPIRIIPAALPGFDEAGQPLAERTPLLLFLHGPDKSDLDRARVFAQIPSRGTCHADGPAYEAPLEGAKLRAHRAVQKQLAAKQLLRPRI